MCLRCEGNDVHKALVFTATYNKAFNIGPWIEGVAKAVPDADGSHQAVPTKGSSPMDPQPR